jgi:hypothetical protein
MYRKTSVVGPTFSQKWVLMLVDRVQLVFGETHCEVDPGSDIRVLTVVYFFQISFIYWKNNLKTNTIIIQAIDKDKNNITV